MLSSQDLKERANLHKSLEGLKKLADMHWKKYRPKMYQALKKKGELEESINLATKNKWEVMQKIQKQLIEQGYTQQQAEDTAWELMREEWIILPEESSEEEEESEREIDFMKLLSMDKPPRNIIL
ncbi:MAG: hypothetical protein QMD43_08735 [Thermodesulfovibrio sp.]|uniref:hypothetical protein n=1 Tax=Thermodesulfovibrio sp. 1176 TaxID=3043424 RepID=UPI0024825CA5|nr:hypothetical protein [Thermodesulfovibrio sp. 1176]MDI1471515.1 hypothetical protein [Thermodesulfovibrio sp. 1176]MDI6715087.1 hypothetical protein [Thermodesulfovibrio sp.]